LAPVGGAGNKFEVIGILSKVKGDCVSHVRNYIVRMKPFVYLDCHKCLC
jgi:hypothetical protein